MMVPDYYDTMGLPEDATQEDIYRRYWQLIRSPFAGMTETDDPDSRMKVLIAYGVLRNPKRRRQYDAIRSHMLGRSNGAGLTFVYSAAEDSPTVPPQDDDPPTRMVETTSPCCELVAPRGPALPAESMFGCDPTCPLQAANLNYHMGRLVEARQLCDQHLASNTRSHRALELRGDVYAQQLDSEHALESYRCAVALAREKRRLEAKISLLSMAPPTREYRQSTSVAFETERASSGAAEHQAQPESVVPPPCDSTAGVDSEHPALTDILVVEDNPIVQRTIVAILANHGLSASTASNGEEAVALVASRSFRMVLMDISMPVLNGLTATRQIRRLPGGSRLPIVAVTAMDRLGDRERCLSAGMDYYLAKPVQPQSLIEAVNRFILAASINNVSPA